MIRYRPEIDGLRALAVLPVVLFHANFEWFRGGFVGVDVFFVISGYLITSLILSDVARGSFSIMRFYERRARRILPALFLVILCTIPIVWFLYLPADMKDYAESVAAIPLFLSNFVFESQSGYFERATDLKPLIHTWSLAVEEQFYLFFPGLFLILLRVPRVWTIGILLLVSFASLALAQWATYAAPTDAYFLLPTRIWEMLMGAIIAVYLFDQEERKISEVGCVLGVAMIFYSVVIFNTETRFPGLSALLPTVGTVLFIMFSGPNTLTFKVFSNRYIVMLGLISYSLYLWHQPIFAIVKYQSLEELSVLTRIILIVISIFLAFISWKYIEKPWRDGAKTSKKKLTVYGLGLSVIFVVFGLWGTIKDGDMNRFDAKTLSIANPVSGGGCPTDIEVQGGCHIGNTAKAARIIIMGDSHASRLGQALHEQLLQRDDAAILFVSGWCPPLDGVEVASNKEVKCYQKRNDAFEFALTESAIDTIILHAEWANYTTGTRWGRRSLRLLRDEATEIVSVAENQKVFERGIKRTVARLTSQNKKVWIIKSVPEYTVNVPNILAIQFSQTGDLSSDSFGITTSEYIARNKGVQTAFDQLPHSPMLSFVDPFSVFCPQGRCQSFDKRGQVLYTDSNHLSLEGARMLMPAVSKSLK